MYNVRVGAGHVTCLAERYDGSIVSACEAGQVAIWQTNGTPKVILQHLTCGLLPR